ncbi:10226_t:CDS:2 [Gigaspora rosea]|nr:10226_t:CDS:2 [Gigaspora rosea]
MELSSGFKGCIGFLDGTHVILGYKPTIDGETYYNRKTNSLTIQLICDRYDSTAYKSTPLFQNVQKFFNEGEYLLADCGYQLTSTTIVPYKQPYASILEMQSLMNYLLESELELNMLMEFGKEDLVV